jgi:uncharacterized surface protein with fasciclin (FAS1) repeats
VLSTLAAAITEAGLAETLNSSEALTLFAPTNDAFAKIPEDTLAKVLADDRSTSSAHSLCGRMRAVGSSLTLIS